MKFRMETDSMKLYLNSVIANLFCTNKCFKTSLFFRPVNNLIRVNSGYHSSSSGFIYGPAETKSSEDCRTFVFLHHNYTLQIMRNDSHAYFACAQTRPRNAAKIFQMSEALVVHIALYIILSHLVFKRFTIGKHERHF